MAKLEEYAKKEYQYGLGNNESVEKEETNTEKIEELAETLNLIDSEVE